MHRLTPEMLRRGTDAPVPERTELRAGPLSLLWQGAGVRRLRLGGFEVLRRVYFAVRDRNWGTVPNAITRLERRIEADRFELEFGAECRQNGVDFAWTGRVTGAPDGSVVFHAEGEARSSFMSNRIGFCVLHPIEECACRACTVEHTDGTAEHGSFPYHVSPHQPFRDMRSVSHEVTPDLWAEVRFEGDTFEMEDQRNWTDASYKSYSRSLALPYPFEVSAGQRFVQTVRLTFNGEPAAPRSLPERPVLTLKRERAGALPAIGLSVSGKGRELSETETERLAALSLHHLRVDVDLGARGAAADLAGAAAQAEALGCALEVALSLADDWRESTAELAELRAPVAACVLLHAGGPGAAAARLPEVRALLGEAWESARFGVGSDANFTELNRDRPPFEGLDLVSFAANPQVHAFDDMSIMETPEGLGWAVRTARHFAGDLPIAVSALTLRRRSRSAGMSQGQPGPDADPRQMSLLAAAWTVGCLKSLTKRGADSITLFETTGRRGVMEAENAPPTPDPFPALPGCVFPVYHVLAALEGFVDAGSLELECSRPLDVQGLAVERSGEVRLLVANMTDTLQRAELRGLAAAAGLKLLDERTAERAMREPEAFIAEQPRVVHCREGCLELELLPYAVAIIDLQEGVLT